VRNLLLSLLLTCCFSLDVEAIDPAHSYKLYLIRHAEKVPDGTRDPVLTEAGKKRAEQLAAWFEDKELNQIWSSDYHRTRDTATPLLTQSGLKLSLYDPDAQAELVKQLFERQQNALIIGHSNTIPALARLLCECTIADMQESEHDRLIIVSVEEGTTMVRVLQQNQLFKP